MKSKLTYIKQFIDSLLLGKLLINVVKVLSELFIFRFVRVGSWWSWRLEIVDLLEKLFLVMVQEYNFLVFVHYLVLKLRNVSLISPWMNSISTCPHSHVKHLVNVVLQHMLMLLLLMGYLWPNRKLMSISRDLSTSWTDYSLLNWVRWRWGCL